MNRHLGVLLDWTVVDFVFLGIAIQQYISISRDLKRSRAQAEQEKQASTAPDQVRGRLFSEEKATK